MTQEESTVPCKVTEGEHSEGERGGPDNTTREACEVVCSCGAYLRTRLALPRARTAAPPAWPARPLPGACKCAANAGSPRWGSGGAPRAGAGSWGGAWGTRQSKGDSGTGPGQTGVSARRARPTGEQLRLRISRDALAHLASCWPGAARRRARARRRWRRCSRSSARYSSAAR